MTPDRERLAERLRTLGEREGLALEEERWRRLGQYVALLLRWSERMNLTALDGGGRGLGRLAIEPLLAARHVPPVAAAMLDVGSGGGSPAIPMKIGRPELLLRMVESRARKAAFLRHAVRELELSGVEVENCRYEALAERPGMRDSQDVITVRGVRLEDAAGGLRSFLKPGGRVLAFRSAGQSGITSDAEGASAGGTRVPLGETGSELVVVHKPGPL